MLERLDDRIADPAIYGNSAVYDEIFSSLLPLSRSGRALDVPGGHASEPGRSLAAGHRA